MNKPPKLFVIIAILFSELAIAQPSNDNCANAISLSTGLTCVAGTNSFTGQTLSGATVEGAGITSACGATTSQDVWYKFVAQCPKPTITISNKGSNWTATTMRIQLLSGSCGGPWTALDCFTNPGAVVPTSNLTLGSTYYLRIHKNNTTAPSGANWGFDICLTGGQQSRMNEVFKQTIIANGTIVTPWEVTYGPDGYLWVTGSQDYKAYRIDPNTSPYTPGTILDIHNGSATAELTPTEHTTFNVQFDAASLNALPVPPAWPTTPSPTKVPWPQGGFAGLALHPQFSSGKPYVYISYVRKYDSTSVTNNGGFYFRNSLVRFTYNSTTQKLESPIAICDTLPGSNDHNSQRIIIAPYGGTDYLFYGQGDMGAGQLKTQWRPNHAQDSTWYEGKILRFNLEPDLDADPSDQWIPNDNPFIHGGRQSAVWDIGIRNNQGFAYNPSTGVMYGSSHGPYSDDEINIIQRYKNYGHPLIEGYSSDGNYDGNSTPGTSTSFTAGVPFTVNSGVGTLSPIGSEATNAATINASGFAPYKDPLFSAYPGATGTGTGSVAKIWSTNPTNSGWPSEAWSGLDVYTSSLIPGWKNSLMVCGLKWGRVLRLKLDAAGTSIVQTNGADTIAYWQGLNRFRDVAFDPTGKDIFVSVDGTGNASGPGGTAPPASVAKCNNCIIKYTFLGYADAGGKSTLSTSIPVTVGTGGSCTTGTTVVVDDDNKYLWVPITGPDGNILAEIYPNGNLLGNVTSSFYINNSGGIRVDPTGRRILDRNITITPTVQPSTPVKVRLYLSNAEYTALQSNAASGVTGLNSLIIRKNNDPCGNNLVNQTTVNITPTYAEDFGTGGKVLQGESITSFSSFYIGSNSIILPVSLVYFNGILENNTTLLKWETANELNTSRFIIERSIDAHNFAQIGTVAAKGNSTSTTDYKYTDYDVMKQSSSAVYYRLKIMDKDDAYKYSDVVKIILPFVTSRVNLFPNPANDEVNVTIDAAIEGNAQWKLLDNTGRVILQNKEMLRKGNNSFPISISKLSTGVYYFVVSGPGIDQQVKLQKL